MSDGLTGRLWVICSRCCHCPLCHRHTICCWPARLERRPEARQEAAGCGQWRAECLQGHTEWLAESVPEGRTCSLLVQAANAFPGETAYSKRAHNVVPCPDSLSMCK